MKKFLKGFTLIELIVVMAILVILMAAIMQMFKPIRETYVDATLYENRRTAQNGIIQYISESVRYATDLGVYNDSDISSAVNKFATEYCKKNSSVTEDDVKKAVEVIIIDNTKDKYIFDGHNHTGRVLRRSNIGSSTLSETLGSGCRLALGAAYYGDNDYAIKLSKPYEDPTEVENAIKKKNPSMSSSEVSTAVANELADWSGDEGIKVTVASTAKYGQRTLQGKEGLVDSSTGEFNSKLVTTEGLVVCPNLSRSGGMFDVSKDAPAGGGPGGGGATPTPGPGAPGKGSSKNDAVTMPNGILSDDTVGEYKGTGPGGGGGGGGGGGTPTPTPSPDNEWYDETKANAPDSKVYIVYLNQKL